MLCDYLLSGQYGFDMVRTYKRKTERDAYGYILKAALLALEDHWR